MDPFSITVGCVTLITVVSECVKGVTNSVNRFRDARQDLAAVTRELTDLQTTLHILKDDKTADQLPRDLRERICGMIENCNGVLEELKTLIQKYDGAGIDHAAKWALSGKRDFEKVRSSLSAHKGALSLVVEATTLHMATKVTDQTKKISVDTAVIKDYTMKIVEQLAKQDEILEQIAWIRALITQKSTEGSERTHAIDEYLDNMSSYAESVYSDSLSEEIAENMRILSLETRRGGSPGVSSATLCEGPELLPPLSHDEPELMTIVLGNSHRLVEPRQSPRNPKRVNKHLWSFYVQASGEEIIEHMIIDLHPTFRPSVVTIDRSPYRITRIGWGVFNLDVIIVLKPGYRWHQNNRRGLALVWELDFNGFGSSTSLEEGVIFERSDLDSDSD